MQSDGSLVVTKSGSTEVIYTSDNNGVRNGPYSLVMREDGNLVIYGGGSTTDPNLIVFTSGSQGLDAPPYVFIMQDDGNAVVYGATAPIWSTANGINQALVGWSAKSMIWKWKAKNIENICPSDMKNCHSIIYLAPVVNYKMLSMVCDSV